MQIIGEEEDENNSMLVVACMITLLYFCFSDYYFEHVRRSMHDYKGILHMIFAGRLQMLVMDLRLILIKAKKKIYRIALF